MDYKLDLCRFIWYHKMDSGSSTKSDSSDLSKLYQDLLRKGTEGKLLLENKIKKQLMNKLDDQKYVIKAKLNDKLLLKEVNKDLATGHIVHE